MQQRSTADIATLAIALAIYLLMPAYAYWTTINEILSKDAAPAWVQAIFSVLAILTSAYFVRWQVSRQYTLGMEQISLQQSMLVEQISLQQKQERMRLVAIQRSACHRGTLLANFAHGKLNGFASLIEGGSSVVAIQAEVASADLDLVEQAIAKLQEERYPRPYMTIDALRIKRAFTEGINIVGTFVTVNEVYATPERRKRDADAISERCAQLMMSSANFSNRMQMLDKDHLDDDHLHA